MRGIHLNPAYSATTVWWNRRGFTNPLLRPWNRFRFLEWSCCAALGLIKSRPRVSIQTSPSKSAKTTHGILIGSSY